MNAETDWRMRGSPVAGQLPSWATVNEEWKRRGRNTKQNKTGPGPTPNGLWSGGHWGSIETVRTIPLPSFLSSATGCFSPGWFHCSIAQSHARLKQVGPSVAAPHAQPNGMRASAFWIPFSRPRFCFVSLLVLRAGGLVRMRGMRGSRHCEPGSPGRSWLFLACP